MGLGADEKPEGIGKPIHRLARCTLNQVRHMKILTLVIRAAAAISLVVAFVLLTVILTIGQTTIQVPSTPVATARIPFDFWIAGSHLPDGDYTVESILDTLVLFRNAQANAQEHAFLIPTGYRVDSREYKIVFVVRNREYHLREVWNAKGKAILTSHIDEGPGDMRREIFTGEEPPRKTVAGR